VFWAGRAGQIEPLMGFVPGLKAFVAAVIGGVGSLPGAVLGGFLLGFAEVLFVGLLPPAYGAYRDAFVFGLLILVLLVLPNGLLGRPRRSGHEARPPPRRLGAARSRRRALVAYAETQLSGYGRTVIGFAGIYAILAVSLLLQRADRAVLARPSRPS
jgi:hypothetical protein